MYSKTLLIVWFLFQLTEVKQKVSTYENNNDFLKKIVSWLVLSWGKEENSTFILQEWFALAKMHGPIKKWSS